MTTPFPQRFGPQWLRDLVLDLAMPIIEAEINKLQAEVERLDEDKAEMEQMYEDALGHLRAANEGLKREKTKTIEVLEGFKCALGDDFAMGWWFEQGYPLLNKLKSDVAHGTAPSPSVGNLQDEAQGGIEMFSDEEREEFNRGNAMLDEWIDALEDADDRRLIREAKKRDDGTRITLEELKREFGI